LKCYIYFCVAWDEPLPETRVILGAGYTAVNGLTRISRSVSTFLINKDNLATPMITYVYDVPLSRRTTALFDGAPCTPVDTEKVSAPTNRESNKTFQRVGEFTGHVGILLVLVTFEYPGSVSPAFQSINK
jgi:hypothetical protein